MFYFFMLLFCILPIYGEEPWGKDAEVHTIISLPQHAPSFFVKMIDLYQHHLSPTTGARSHFDPTSSMYMKQAIHRYGLCHGIVAGLDRLLRENDELWIYSRSNYRKWVKYDPP